METDSVALTMSLCRTVLVQINTNACSRYLILEQIKNKSYKINTHLNDQHNYFTPERTI